MAPLANYAINSEVNLVTGNVHLAQRHLPDSGASSPISLTHSTSQIKMLGGVGLSLLELDGGICRPGQAVVQCWVGFRQEQASAVWSSVLVARVYSSGWRACGRSSKDFIITLPHLTLIHLENPFHYLLAFLTPPHPHDEDPAAAGLIANLSTGRVAWNSVGPGRAKLTDGPQLGLRRYTRPSSRSPGPIRESASYQVAACLCVIVVFALGRAESAQRREKLPQGCALLHYHQCLKTPGPQCVITVILTCK
uniref:Uncharacterized protein n=1 Tax=Oryza glumipatula TaxID=40148 RepID=A0A0D9Z1V4_9ORYZ